MHLKYEFVVITNEQCLRGVQARLQSEYEFAYSPFIPGEQKLFRDVPDLVGYDLPAKVLLFKYVPEDPDDDYRDSIAAQDIVSGLEYLGVMGWDTSLWEWQAFSSAGEEAGCLPIQYKYVNEGDDSRIYYEVAPDLGKEAVLISALESIRALCGTKNIGWETPEEFAERVELMATKALTAYEQRRV